MSLQRSCVQAVFFVLLAGCGNSPQQQATVEPEAVEPSNYYVGNDAVYAVLKSGSAGSWVFGEVTESDLPPEKGFLIRLNDLAPAFDTRLAECQPQAYSTNHKCNPVHPFRDKDVGVISKIINGGIAAGTAGKVTDVASTYKTTFNEAAFNQAVDEALVNSGLNRDRQELLHALDNYVTMYRDSRATLDELRRNADDEYRDTSTVDLDIQPRLSGLTEYYTGDLDYRELVELVPISEGDSGRTELKQAKLLPCDARECVRKARNAMTSMQADVEKSRRRMQSSPNDVYAVRCSKTTHAGYLFQMQCPGQVERGASGSAALPLEVELLARDFEGLYPEIRLGDDNLAIVIADSELSFMNKTSDYLSITAQTVYYNSQIQTSATQISLAPGAVVKRPVSEFVSPSIHIESSYRQMTPDKADSSTFQFGFAAKYRGARDSAETTLFEKREFNVGCVIKDRIGSRPCDQSPNENLQVTERTTVPY
ncbi:MAG: hypothetical protein ACR2Q3_05775 [Woeseiaceae bacterium]